jgi:hypothetical protein
MQPARKVMVVNKCDSVMHPVTHQVQPHGPLLGQPHHVKSRRVLLRKQCSACAWHVHLVGTNPVHWCMCIGCAALPGNARLELYWTALYCKQWAGNDIPVPEVTTPMLSRLLKPPSQVASMLDSLGLQFHITMVVNSGACTAGK